jgi:hypothetical protein
MNFPLTCSSVFKSDQTATEDAAKYEALELQLSQLASEYLKCRWTNSRKCIKLRINIEMVAHIEKCKI